MTGRANATPLGLDLIFGADALAFELGMTKRQIYHAAAVGHLPTFKIGSTVCARRSTLVAWIERQEALAGIPTVIGSDESSLSSGGGVDEP